MSQEPTNSAGQQHNSARHRRPWRPPNGQRGRGRGKHRPSSSNNNNQLLTNGELARANFLQNEDFGNTIDCPESTGQQIYPNRANIVSDRPPQADPARQRDRSDRRELRNGRLNRQGRGGSRPRRGRSDVVANENEAHPPRNIEDRGHQDIRCGQVQWPPRRGRVSNFRYLNESNVNRNDQLDDVREAQYDRYQNSCSSDQVYSGCRNHISTPSKIKHPPDQDNSSTSNIQSEIAESQFKSNNFECMICCDNIHKSNPIWCCGNCYNIFHLKCAIEWCNKSIKSRNEAITNAQYPSLGQLSNSRSNQVDDFEVNHQSSSSGGYSNYQTERVKSVEWPCPTCREVQFLKPDKYKCFCGKVVRPEINRHLTPHSCGQLCGRPRPNSDCPHTCNSICHPGRCAPCLLTSRKPCYCGKLIREIKCSVVTKSCDEPCAKPLTCGRHFCTKICHNGACGPCDEVLTITCNCGRESIQKLCSSIKLTGAKALEHFSCEKVCGNLLDCGKHFCNKRCHPGPSCPSCKLLSSNLKTCPCGSTLIKKSLLQERKFCTDPVPTCDNKCNATLICGPEKNRHKCQKKCHTGQCPPCKLKTPALCKCKLSTKTIDCLLMYDKVIDGEQVYFKQTKYSFSCETRCNALKYCGRHRCTNKCCEFNKTIGASVHSCDQKCNKKLPCGLHTCPEACHPGQCGDCTNIGWEELTCHCGLSVLYPPIPCGARPPACHRLCRRAHNCGHPVKHECHDDTEKCAPCTVFVKKSCFCGSDSKDSVYCYLPGYSCGRTCKKLLKCNKHTCKRVCHDNDCETPDERGVILCPQPCPVPRYICKHPCGLPCHGMTPCMSSECRKIMEVTCECGNKKDRLECYKIMRDVDNRNKVAMLSTNRSNQDSIIIDLSNKPVANKSGLGDNSFLKQLDCDETCSILERNKALAEALDIAQPDLKPASIFGEDPLRLLKEATAQDYKFVATTFNSLARFVKSAKESDKRFIFMQFSPAGKLRREVIHELAHHFNCTSESRDEEPFKHVVVRAYKNKSCVPDFNIEQLLPVTD